MKDFITMRGRLYQNITEDISAQTCSANQDALRDKVFHLRETTRLRSGLPSYHPPQRFIAPGEEASDGGGIQQN
jgi:hypothetical protein